MRTSIILLTLLLGFIFTCTDIARAGTITKHHAAGTDFSYLYFEGKIVEGDAWQLQNFIDINQEARWIFFDSKGGSVVEGMKIAKVIRESSGTYTTAIFSGAMCVSACVHAFVGGDSRYVRIDKNNSSNSGQIGIHPAYYKTSVNAARSINDYLHDGQLLSLMAIEHYIEYLPINKIKEFVKLLNMIYTKTKSTSMYYVTPAEALKAGIITNTY